MIETEDAPDSGSEVVFEASVTRILELIGEDPTREGLLKTPQRVSASLQFLTHGRSLDPKKILESAIFNETVDEMVVVRDIELYSLCEHHLLPFFGKCHIAYLPDGKIVGLSKLPRVVDCFARRLQVQERLTSQIAHAINDTLKPKSVGVVIEAQHLCMMMRGVQKQASRAVTSTLIGAIKDDAKARDEFLRLIGIG